MASGYLGKISAVIAANTGDYVRGLNEGAKATRNFSKDVQSTLTRSARDAAKAFEGIYTPLQQVERALRQAGKLRLNFAGFEGAIKNVNQLRDAFQGVIGDQEARLIVKTTGLKDIEAVRAAIKEISTKEVALATNAGGLAGLQKLRADMTAKGQTSTTLLDVEVDTTQIDEAIRKLTAVGGDRNIDIIIDILNERKLNEAVVQFQRLTELARDVAAPLGSAAQAFGRLSAGAKAGLIGPLTDAQKALEQFRANIKNVDVKQYEALKRSVEQVVAAINQATNAEQKERAAREAVAQATARRIAENDKLITQERELAAAIRRTADEEAKRFRESVTGASAALTRRAPPPTFDPANLESQAASARLAVANARSTPDGQRLREQLRGVNAELENIASEEARLSSIDPLREQIPQWEELRRRVSEAGFALAAIEAQAKKAGGAASPRGTAADAQADRLRSLRAAATTAVTGFTGTVEGDIDRQFQSILARVKKFDLADRVNLGPAINEFLKAAEAGAGYAEQLQAIAKLEGAVGAVETGPTPPRPSEQFGPTGLPRGLGGDPRGGTGRDVADIGRQIDNLTSRSTALKASFDALPASFRSRLLPAIRAADDSLIRFKASTSQSDDDVARLAAQFTTVERAVAQAASAAQRFGGSFADFKAERDARAAAAGLEFLRTALLRARGDATEATIAVDRLAEALKEAASTPGGFQKNAAELQRLQNDAIKALSALDGINASQGSLQRGFVRAGDIARGSFGNVGLAVQQAAFAFEDFFSVTGGLDQRIRAAGNNISQLGFILGGPWGLGVGIAIGVGAQFAAMLLKWANGGKDAQDELRALNSVLDRQKSIVQELADAFSALGDNLTGGFFAQAGNQAAEFAKQIENIARLQREFRENLLTEFDPDIVANRTRQNTIQRTLENENVNQGQRIQLQLELDRLRREERAARESALTNQPSVNAARAAARAAFEDVVSQDLRAGRIDIRPSEVASTADDRAQQLIERILSASPADRLAIIRQQQEEFERRRPILGRRDAEFDAASQGLEQLLRQLQDRDSDRQGMTEDIQSTARAMQDAAIGIDQAQKELADAIERGVPEAELLGSRLAEYGGELLAASRDLERAQALPVERQPAAVAAALGRVNAARQGRDQVRAEIDQLALRRGFGGSRLQDSIAALQGSQSLRVTQAAQIAVSQRAANQIAISSRDLQNAVVARDRAIQLRARGQGSDEEVAAANEAVAAAARNREQVLRSADAIAGFNEQVIAADQALSGLRDGIEAAVQTSRSTLDAAQRRLDERTPVELGGLPAERLLADRNAAQQQLITDQAEAQRLQNNLDQAQARVQASPEFARITGDLQAINDRRAQIEEQARGGDAAAVAELANIQERERQLIAERARVQLQGVQAELDAIDEFRAATQERDRRQQDAIEGQRLARTPGEQSRIDLDQQIQKLEADALQRANALIPNAALRFGTIDEAAAGLEKRTRDDVERAAISDSLRGLATQLLRDLEDGRVGDFVPSDTMIAAVNRLGDAPRSIELLENAAGDSTGLTPEEYAANVLAALEETARAFDDTILRTDGIRSIFSELEADRERLRQEAFRQAAPNIFGLADAVQNAILQGPSRAALQATDVSTVEGSRELSRLLRGDDAARNQDLVTLQREANGLLREIAQGGAQVAN